ncbi:MAG: radical SAM protein, partial [Clostridiales bacterium]|nr:radical SAM protein [Clostridiales bacterium]
MKYPGVMVDMAGCPNRCRHCWLGAKPNGHMDVETFVDIARQFKGWRDENGQGIHELAFFSWWREPDFHDDYRALWQLEQVLSSPGRAQRFELLST